MKIGTVVPVWTLSMGGDTPRATDVIDYARLAEEIGFDSLWIIDHFCYEPYLDYQEQLGVDPPESLKGVRRGAWECFTMAASLATATERVEIGTLVANTGYRNPALLARMAETVDDVSDGRFVLGLGAGDMPSEHRAFGFPYERRVGRFEEALQIIRPMLRGESVTLKGEFYRTEAAELIPKGVRPEGPPILIGVLQGGPRMRRLVVQYADHWNAWLAYSDSRPDGYLETSDLLSAACEKHGRDPMTLERNITIAVCMPGEQFPIGDAVPLTGSTVEIVESLSKYADFGLGHESIFPYPNTPDTLESLAPLMDQLR